MIGVFDSGLGWVQTLLYLREVVPDASYFYLWDTAFVPYGDKESGFVRQRTFACLRWLFDQWCTLVILACNTASAVAIREWQTLFPEKKVLSITLPGIEAIVDQGYHCVALLATALTIRTALYPSMMERHYPQYPLEFIGYNGSGLVELLECGASTEAMRETLQALFSDGLVGGCDALLLWSTHYPLLISYLEELFPTLPLINPWWEATKKLPAYLQRHSEIVIQQMWTVRKCVTGMGRGERVWCCWMHCSGLVFLHNDLLSGYTHTLEFLDNISDHSWFATNKTGGRVPYEIDCFLESVLDMSHTIEHIAVIFSRKISKCMYVW